MLPAMDAAPRMPLLIVFVVLVVAVGCGGGRDQTACDFKGKWPPGRKCVYRVDVREEKATRASGRSVTSAAIVKPHYSQSTGHEVTTNIVETVWQNVDVSFAVRDGPEKGDRIADLVILSAAVEKEQRAKRKLVRVGSKLSGVAGARVDCHLDQKGGVEGVEGVDAFMRQVISDGQMANDTFAEVFNEDFLKQMRITGWKLLPDGPASPGYSWVTSDKIEFPGIGRILVRQRHRFDKWETRGDERCARISWWGSVGNLVEIPAQDQALLDNVEKVESVGWCLFSPSLGIVVEWAEDFTVLTVLEGSERSLHSTDVTQEIHRRIGVKLAGAVVDSKKAGGRLFADRLLVEKKGGG
jgi:hypothetical protein